ncbi:uncharacterized protein LAESUDRAFT_716226 [Laetiporus sulphureus 93-53]|uniref:Uncharacterized protein n=1 Tax=Laetiporus sulphureus 93-53 TaxID=1314785 RepID=A0A165CTG6_9APHY|nr:uncharacterized protein LAESUDRAFT_716226 [Laetiporus sulphureus 93-53]KZT03407.1 hypothetical protein LAESUDRAFT_716226 [Laetiporus sulphureus 93-53]
MPEPNSMISGTQGVATASSDARKARKLALAEGYMGRNPCGMQGPEMATRPLLAQKVKVNLGSTVLNPAEHPHSDLRGFLKPVAGPPSIKIWGSVHRLGEAQTAADIQAEIATLKRKLAEAEAAVADHEATKHRSTSVALGPHPLFSAEPHASGVSCGHVVFTSNARTSVLHPASQIEPGSYLEAAFKQLTGGGDEPPGDSPPSSDSSSDSSSSDDESSDSTSSGNGRQGARRHHHAKKKNSRVPVLKPREPSTYDGKFDVQEFHKFMREMTEYIDETLFLMAGVSLNQECIDKLWTGLNAYIQKGLWLQKLMPMHSSWEDVRKNAETLEIAEHVGSPQKPQGLKGDGVPPPQGPPGGPKPDANGKVKPFNK